MPKKSKPRERLDKGGPSGEVSHRPFANLSKRPLANPPKRPIAEQPKRARPRTEPSAEPLPREAEPNFAAIMSGVEAMQEKARRLPKAAAAPLPGAPVLPPPDLDIAARLRLDELSIGGIRFDVVDDGAVLEGRRIDLDPRALRRLRRGEVHPDGTLDLHGMTAVEAHVAVDAFLSKRSSEGDRAVAIVHGRGTHSEGGHGVLRGELGAWLSQGKAKRYVAAFASQIDRDGRSGAVLVLLARGCSSMGNPRRT
jgi:DNA-nicking Smr family endonuclease